METKKGAWTTTEKTEHKQNNTHKNRALGFSKINTDKTWRSALGWEGGRSAPINAAARRRWEIGAAAAPIVFYLTWVWVCVGRVTGQWWLKEKKMKWKELREVDRLTILTDKVLRQWVPQIVEIFEWWEVKTKTKRVGYFKWWVMSNEWWVTEIEWWVMKKYKSKQGLSVLVRVWWDGCLDFFFFF